MPATSQLDTVKFEEFAKPLLENGRYATVNEVLAAAMDALLREECDDAAKLAYLRQAVDDGLASGIAEGDVLARVRQRAGLPVRASR